MIKHWEEFKVGPKDTESELHVSLNRKGEILIGVRAFERLNKPEYVVFYFDRINKRIGLLPASEKTANAYPLVKKTRHAHRVIRASRFVRHHQIGVTRTVAFNDVEIDEDGVLTLDLMSTRSIGKPAALTSVLSR